MDEGDRRSSKVFGRLDDETELVAGAYFCRPETARALTPQCDYLMATEYSSFAGWERNLKLSNDFVEVIITLEVGPAHHLVSTRSRSQRL